MMTDPPDVDSRLQKLEGDNRKKLLVQYLVYPGLLLIIGWYLNRTLESQKLEVQRIQVVQTLLPSLFGENHSQALATELIVSRVEPDLAEDLHKITANYYEAKLRADIESDQLESVNSIISAARSVGGPAAEQILKSANTPATNMAIGHFQLALRREQEGFSALLNGKYADAQVAFQQSEDAYNGYHQVYEIARLLRMHKQDFNNPVAMKVVLNAIVKEDYRGAPPELLDKLRDRLNAAGG